MADFEFDFMLKELPPIVWRSRWNQLAARHGLPFKKGYMENLDSLGLGPARVVLRGRVAYRREDLVSWLNHFMGCDHSEHGAADMQGKV